MNYILVVISNSRAKNSASKSRDGLLASRPIEKSVREKTVDQLALQNKYKNYKFSGSSTFVWYNKSLDRCPFGKLFVA